jgi:hypothetical protein
MAEFTVEVQRTSKLISSEPGAPGAPSRMAVTPRNPREKGKRGGGARTHRLAFAGVQRHCDFLVLFPLSSLPSLPFNDPKHGGTLVGENTRGCGLAAREVWGWAKQYPKISEKLTGHDPGWAGPGDRYPCPLFVFVPSFSLC